MSIANIHADMTLEWKLELVALPVADPDRSIAFYRDRLGWNVDHDHTVNPDLRFVQITPPGSACSVAFGVGMVDEAQGPVRTLQVVVADIEAAHAHLVAAGVEVSDIDDQPWGSFVYFDDPDGNRWAAQQIQPRG